MKKIIFPTILAYIFFVAPATAQVRLQGETTGKGLKDKIQSIVNSYQADCHCLDSVITVKDSLMPDLLTQKEELFYVHCRPGEIIVNMTAVYDPGFDDSVFVCEVGHELWHETAPKDTTFIKVFSIENGYGYKLYGYHGLGLIVGKNKNQLQKNPILEEAVANFRSGKFCSVEALKKYEGYYRNMLLLQKMLDAKWFKMADLIKAQKTNDVPLFVSKILNIQKKFVGGKHVILIANAFYDNYKGDETTFEKLKRIRFKKGK